MRKLLLILLCLIGLSATSQTVWYKADSYAYKYKESYEWTEWTDWISCNINVKIDWDDDVIVIYSKRTQIYVVTDIVGNGNDPSGGKYAEFKVLDQDYDIGHIRLRIESNGNSQIYVDFADVMWVYNVRKQ